MAAVYTEFYVQTTGSNLNAGSTTSDTAAFTYASGNWVAGTGVFTVASGNPLTDGVTVDAWVSVYADGASATGFVGRVTAVDATTITVSLAAKGGTAPTDGTGNRTLKVGGAWGVPTSTFPASIMSKNLMNTSNNTPRINFKAGVDYNITATIAITAEGPITFEGYTATPGDGGRAWFDGGTTGTSFTLMSNTNANYNCFINLGFKNNGNSGTARDGFTNTGNALLMYGLIAHSIRRTGIQTTGNTTARYCEAYNCNQSNTSNQGAFSFASAGSSLERCIAHSNRNGTNGNGFIIDTSLNFIMCLAVNNQAAGVISNADTNQNFYFSDFCFNDGDGFRYNGGSQVMQSSFTGCNFIGNGGYGLRFRSFGHVGILTNCGFGSGTMANGLGDIYSVEPWAVKETGTIIYTANTTPYRDYVNGDFSIISAESKGQGSGAFLMTKSGYSGTVGYPDVGAAASQPTSAGGGGYGFSG